MANKWRILHRPLNVSTDLAVDIVKTCCLLQNFIQKEEGIINSMSNDSTTEDLNFDLRQLPRSNSVRGSLSRGHTMIVKRDSYYRESCYQERVIV
jgi:hypothetical protein